MRFSWLYFACLSFLEKRVLADMLTTFASGDFTDTIVKAEESIFNAAQHSFGAQFLKAKALIQLKKCDKAKNILIHIQGKPVRVEVQIEVARLELKQKQYNHGWQTSHLNQ